MGSRRRAQAWLSGAGLLPVLLLASAPAQLPDISSVEPDLVVPELVDGEPAAGRRVKQTHPDYADTGVHHVLYLPEDWKPGGDPLPVLVEFAGNGPNRNRFGDVSTGRVEGSKMGYGISGGRSFLWLCLPYLDGAAAANVTSWWGTKPDYDPMPTVTYCKKAVRWVCERYGGDPERLVLCGFSRGAIACNFIGLHNDEISSLWRGMICHSHYDGVRQWHYPNSDRNAARERLSRLKGRPQWISHESSVDAVREYLEIEPPPGDFTFRAMPFSEHTADWVLRDLPARREIRKWFRNLTGGKE